MIISLLFIIILSINSVYAIDMSGNDIDAKDIKLIMMLNYILDTNLGAGIKENLEVQNLYLYRHLDGDVYFD